MGQTSHMETEVPSHVGVIGKQKRICRPTPSSPPRHGIHVAFRHGTALQGSQQEPGALGPSEKHTVVRRNSAEEVEGGWDSSADWGINQCKFNFEALRQDWHGLALAATSGPQAAPFGRHVVWFQSLNPCLDSGCELTANRATAPLQPYSTLPRRLEIFLS
jgi:hypothetical protein